MHIQNSKYWKVNFFTPIFQVGNYEKSTKKEGFQFPVTQVVLVKNA